MGFNGKSQRSSESLHPFCRLKANFRDSQRLLGAASPEILNPEDHWSAVDAVEGFDFCKCGL
jgi:hypothetical protein